MKLQDPSVTKDLSLMKEYGKEAARLEPFMALMATYDRLQQRIAAVEDFADDPELLAIAQSEATQSRAELPEIEKKLKNFLIPHDPDDDRGVVLEVRPGTGGEEASLFASELLRMYIRYAEQRGWKTETIDVNATESGGLRDASVRIEGSGVFGMLKHESGVHRVQRIPATENKGRVHTSTATVAILPQVEDVDVHIRAEDLRIDTYRAGGAGGQHVNKTESAVRITHLPSGMVIACQTERSQMKNRASAMSLLRSRLYAHLKEEQKRKEDQKRSSQVGGGDRSEKIRTYNFPQDRVTDHRLEQSFHNLPAIMEGQIGELIQALRVWDEECRLATNESA